jgi:uncharacterized protein YqeY
MKAVLQNAMKESMRAKEKLRLQTIRSLLSAFQYVEMEKGIETLPEEECITILKTELKKRKESLEFAEKAGRADMIAGLREEMAIIESFLPKQLNEEELERVIVSLVAEQANANLGSLMKVLKERFGGQYDGKMASEVAKRVLTA